MKNRPTFKKLQAATKDWTLVQLEALTYQTMRKDFGLTVNEIETFGPYHTGMKNQFIRDLKAIHEEQAKEEMADKLLLSDSTLTPSEALLAAERVFDERRKNGLRSS